MEKVKVYRRDGEILRAASREGVVDMGNYDAEERDRRSSYSLTLMASYPPRIGHTHTHRDFRDIIQQQQT